MQSIKAFFRGVYRQWMRLAHLLGTINKYVFLTLFYWLIIDIANLCVRIARADLLDRRMRAKPSYWHDKKHEQVGSYRSQF